MWFISDATETAQDVFTENDFVLGIMGDTEEEDRRHHCISHPWHACTYSMAIAVSLRDTKSLLQRLFSCKRFDTCYNMDVNHHNVTKTLELENITAVAEGQIPCDFIYMRYLE